jgi:putative toxin-antitoxin system antitoxin component (TIGR02293 family)
MLHKGGIMLQLTRLSKVLGGKQVLHMNLDSLMDLIELGKEGISKKALNHLIEYSSLTLSQITKLLPISERTIQRYSASDRFNSAVSEQILEIAYIVAQGEEVFGDMKKFLAWMNYENPVLGNKKPFDLLNSRFGTDLIIDELGRIEHGVIS